MNTVEKVQAMMVGEDHVRHDESKQWAVKYRTALMELAVELDATLAKIAALQYASLENKWGAVEVPALLQNKLAGEVHKLSKSEATSVRMKAYWAKRKANQK